VILSLFKKTYFAQISWVVIFAIILAIPGFIQSNTAYIPQTTLFLKLICIYPWLQINWVYQLISNLLLLALAFYVKDVFSKNELVHRQNFLPSLLILALFNFLHPFQYQLLAIINLFLIVYAFDFLLKSFEDEHPDNSIFSASLLISMASLISYSNLIFIPFVWLSFFVFQNYSLRYLPITITGLISPYLFLFTYLFWFDKTDLIFIEWESIPDNLYQFISIHGIFDVVNISILGFLSFISLAKILPEIPGKIIAIRQKTSLSLWLLIFSLYPLLFFPDLISNNFFIIPLTGLLAYYLRIVKSKRLWIDFLFTSFIILIIINKYIYATEVFLK
jgi:hypothetical protein